MTHGETWGLHHTALLLSFLPPFKKQNKTKTNSTGSNPLEDNYIINFYWTTSTFTELLGETVNNGDLISRGTSQMIN